MIRYIGMLGLLVATLTGGCAGVDTNRSHYMLKVCSTQGCNIVNLFDSLSYCMEMRDELRSKHKDVSAICEGFREP
jgi:hypothetical protein